MSNLKFLIQVFKFRISVCLLKVYSDSDLSFTVQFQF